MTDEFLFHMRVVDRERDPYYFTNWDDAVPLTVRAVNRDAAFTQAWAVMGKCRSGCYWTAKVDSIEPAPAIAVSPGLHGQDETE